MTNMICVIAISRSEQAILEASLKRARVAWLPMVLEPSCINNCYDGPALFPGEGMLSTGTACAILGMIFCRQYWRFILGLCSMFLAGLAEGRSPRRGFGFWIQAGMG